MATTIKPSVIGEFTYKELKPLAMRLLKQGYSVLVTGHPGCGKSALAYDIARSMGFKDDEIEDIRPAQKDPVELGGMHIPNRETKTVDLYKPEWVPTDKPKFIFIDEINAAVTKLHQSVMYQIVLEKRIGPYRFAKGTVVFAAGNLIEDQAIVAELSSALNNRFAHFILKPDHEGWLEWAGKNGISADYMGYINFRKITALYNNTGEPTFPSPRSNANAGLACNLDDIQGISEDEKLRMMRKLVASFVGTGAATEFMQFKKVYSKINITDIMEKGIMPDIDKGNASESSFVYALVYACASYVSNLNAAKLKGVVLDNTISLIETLKTRPENQIVFVKQLHLQNPAVLKAVQTHPNGKKVISLFATILEEARGIAA